MFKILMLIVLLAACSTPRPTGKTEAEILYKEALQFVEGGRYLLATEKLNSLKSQYPYSYYATHAELLQADILFKQENFVEAAAAYILFKDFHPKHQKSSYVVWRIAESYYNQRPSTFDRDLTPAHEAIKHYQDLLERFPGSEYTRDSLDKIKVCLKMIEDRELYVADFYFRTEVYDASRFRYLKILERFDNKEMRNQSISRVIETSYLLNEPSECKKYYGQYQSQLSGDYKEIADDVYKKCVN